MTQDKDREAFGKYLSGLGYDLNWGDPFQRKHFEAWEAARDYYAGVVTTPLPLTEAEAIRIIKPSIFEALPTKNKDKLHCAAVFVLEALKAAGVKFNNIERVNYD
jgi:hypothetical protein